MTDRAEITRNRLAGWGAWARVNDVSELGFPAQACHLAGLSGGRDYSLENDPAAEEVEKILQIMNIENRLWFRIIKQHYKQGSTNLNGAMWLRIKINIYKTYKGKAEAWVEGALLRSEFN